MISETQLTARGFDNRTDEGYETTWWFSPSGVVSVNMSTPERGYSVCVYKDAVDPEGHLCGEAVIELTKPSTLTIEELVEFTRFAEEE